MTAQTWWHSFEEDHDDVAVYRPDGFGFPPARGRRGLELDPDGTVVELGLGRDDTPSRAAHASGASLEVVHQADDRLEIRRL
ncbi:hypothetical protein [Williamsia sp. 1135]|uniref:hypothetical protein n=1 Tax=Williamsia sp. 1135 TaxID=1889262 RepID=UPI00143C08A3|nr:hypothetical protein [Williamsia sp. 1135]